VVQLSQDAIDTSADLKRNHQAQALLEAWWSFGQLMRQRVMPSVIGQLDLEFKDFLTLTAIHDGAAYPKLICSRLATNPSDISRILEKLEEKNLVTRALDTTDSRRIRVVLTAHGLATVETMKLGIAKHILRGVQHLPASELEHFSRTMQILNTNIQAQFSEEPVI
jgi:DNA-binding MarR family transcriptional regulator